MPDDPRLYHIVRLLHEYVGSPSLRHIRQPDVIHKLALKILRHADGPTSPWQKWSAPREFVAKAALPCWLPEVDLCDGLNRLPGPPLTGSDVVHRMEAMREADPYGTWPNEDLKTGCLLLYEREKAAGTELLAIIGAMQRWIEAEEDRIREERNVANRARIEAERVASLNRLMAGADCPWTQADAAKTWHSRRNGRLYRLVQAEGNRWVLSRVTAVSDKRGVEIGRYESRSAASKVVSTVAYQPDLV